MYYCVKIFLLKFDNFIIERQIQIRIIIIILLTRNKINKASSIKTLLGYSCTHHFLNIYL